MVFFHGFEFDRQRFFGFVQGAFGFSDSFKDDKCLMKLFKEVIKLLIIGLLNGRVWSGLAFGVAELSGLLGWKRSSLVMTFGSFEESLDIHI